MTVGAERTAKSSSSNNNTATAASDSATEQLAEFLADLTGSVEARLLARATDYVLDTIGVTVFGSIQPWSRAVIDFALATAGPGAEASSGSSTVVGAGDAAISTSMAALANGSSAHAFELDDVHEEAISHPGAVVIPAALAVAEAVDASGSDLLEAIVIGYEAMGRAGIAVGPAAHMLSGFHPTSMSGVFGATAAAGRLLGFDASQLNHAFGLATSLASGTMEFSASGGMAKRIHAGRAAEGGVMAALLVGRGVEGARDGLAGRYGFCRVFSPAPQVARLTDKLGSRWMIDEITVKPYAACSDIHPMIQAAAEIRAAHGTDLNWVDGIARIEARGPTKAAEQNSLDGTASVMAAQYSAQFNIAAALIADPTNPTTYYPDQIRHPSLAALQHKVVSVTAAPEFDATYAWKMGGAVRIVMTDGRVFARTVHGQIGSMHAPLTVDHLSAKFHRVVAAAGVDAHDALALEGAVRRIATTPARHLGHALRSVSPSTTIRGPN